MKLSVNIDHIATLRNARGGAIPDPVQAALICENAGAVGIVCHLREDRRHIKDEDVWRLRKQLVTKLDLEMAATEEIIDIAIQVKPDLVTLVPEKRQELTTEGGLDIVKEKKYYAQVVKKFHQNNIPVSLFIAADESQISASADIGSDMIEIHTGEYADATTDDKKQLLLDKIINAAKFAKNLGLGVNAGHGLDYNNIKPIAKIKNIDEVSIGHSLIVRSIFVGLENAVKEMKNLIDAK